MMWLVCHALLAISLTSFSRNEQSGNQPASLTPLEEPSATEPTPSEQKEAGTPNFVWPRLKEELIRGDVFDDSSKSLSVGGLLSFDIGDVDFVYTWYNADDPATGQLRRQELDKHRSDPNIAPDAAASKRFVDSGELKNSLRSVEKYAPWVRKIHIVIGDGQPLPGWLNDQHPKINIVRHSAIFPPGSALPSFNSLAIEACLHRIPGLTEKFVYFNDDMFLGSWAPKEAFFSKVDGRPLVWLVYANWYEGAVKPGDDGHTAAEKNTNTLIKKYAPRMAHYDERAVRTTLRHFMKALNKEMMIFAENMEPDSFAEVRSRQFRSTTSISPITFATMIGVQSGSCENVPIPQSYVANFQDKDPDAIFELLHKEKFVFICLNNSDDIVKERVTRGYQSLFPDKSSFEK